jgi:hypothetical protein
MVDAGEAAARREALAKERKRAAFRQTVSWALDMATIMAWSLSVSFASAAAPERRMAVLDARYGKAPRLWWDGDGLSIALAMGIAALAAATANMLVVMGMGRRRKGHVRTAAFLGALCVATVAALTAIAATC